MRMLRIATLASAAMAVALSAGPSFGQDEDAAAKARANANLDLSYNEVTKDRPFGDMSVDTTMNADGVRIFMEGLSEEERTDIASRCDFIRTDTSHFYDDGTVAFCGLVPGAGERPDASQVEENEAQ